MNLSNGKAHFSGQLQSPGFVADHVIRSRSAVSVRIPVKATMHSGAWRPLDPADDDQGGA
jgi:hypothetical protein